MTKYEEIRSTLSNLATDELSSTEDFVDGMLSTYVFAVFNDFSDNEELNGTLSTDTSSAETISADVSDSINIDNILSNDILSDSKESDNDTNINIELTDSQIDNNIVNDSLSEDSLTEDDINNNDNLSDTVNNSEFYNGESNNNLHDSLLNDNESNDTKFSNTSLDNTLSDSDEFNSNSFEIDQDKNNSVEEINEYDTLINDVDNQDDNNIVNNNEQDDIDININIGANIESNIENNVISSEEDRAEANALLAKMTRAPLSLEDLNISDTFNIPVDNSSADDSINKFSTDNNIVNNNEQEINLQVLEQSMGIDSSENNNENTDSLNKNVTNNNVNQDSSNTVVPTLDSLAQVLQSVASSTKLSTSSVSVTAKSRAAFLTQSSPLNLGTSLRGKSGRVSTVDATGNKISAAAQIRNLINQALPKITSTELTKLTDTHFCHENASLTYPLFMQVNPAMAYKDQANMDGKKRYAREPIQILGNSYYVTNHLFARNIPKVEKMLKSLNLI